MLASKQFQRRIEDFICQQCDQAVTGTGYTNHCPACLWSKHVDVNPGDRAANCGGLMEPVAAETKGNSYVIVHRCQQCGHVKRNKTLPEDNFETIASLAAGV